MSERDYNQTPLCCENKYTRTSGARTGVVEGGRVAVLDGLDEVDVPVQEHERERLEVVAAVAAHRAGHVEQLVRGHDAAVA